MRVTETKLVETHGGTDGSSPFGAAKGWVKRWLAESPEDAPNAAVVGARWNGERCPHGRLLVEVTFEYDADDDE